MLATVANVFNAEAASVVVTYNSLKGSIDIFGLHQLPGYNIMHETIMCSYVAKCEW